MSGGKYLLNALDKSVRDNLLGLALTNDKVQIAEEVNGIVRKDVDVLRQKGSVLVVSGGGAGHEPMFTGFVGPKMLTAAVSGSYFASPSAGHIIRMVEEIATPDSPVLLTLANYTGDRLNFGLAKETLILKGFKQVGMFVFGDDLAPYLAGKAQDEDIEKKRRGLAGIAFIHMISGVLSEHGKSLEEIEASLRKVSKLIYTISISLSAADIPGHGASFTLESDSMELGLGVHGESGIKRVSMLPARETINLMLSQLITYLDQQSILDTHQRKVALIVNNLGGLIPLEMNVILKEVSEQLLQHKITLERVYSGQYMTSFNMRGVSLSLILVDDQLLSILDEANQAHQGTNGRTNPNYIYRFNSASVASSVSDTSSKASMYQNFDPSLFRKILVNACKEIMKNEQRLNKLDETVGDSDCGSTLSAIAKLFLDRINQSTDYPPTFAELAQIVGYDIGGSSGALYSLLLTAAQQFMQTHRAEIRSVGDHARFWLGLVQQCIHKICTYSGARVNDRSMIDGLHGIVLGLEQCLSLDPLSLTDIIRVLPERTWEQANKTATMKARVGRAAYVNEAYVTNPDAGATGVAVWTQAIADTLAQLNPV